jgi:hypothetical protein
MGGKVSTTPVNPELEQAQIESMRQNMVIGKKQQELSDQMRPMQMDQIKFGMDASKQAYKDTQDDRSYALAKRDQYDKALGGLLNETDNFDEASRRLELGQQAAADVSSAFSQAGDQQRRQVSRMGVNPLSGKALMADQGVELEEAKARAQASRMVSEAAHAEGLQKDKAAVGMLAGYPQMASQLSPNSARLGWGSLDAANTGVAGLMSNFTTGAALNEAVGKNASGMYGLQSDLWAKSSAQNSDANSEVYGAAAGAAGSYFGSKYGTGSKKGGGAVTAPSGRTYYEG